MLRLILLRLLESYFRHRWLYLVPLALMLAVGVAVAWLVPAKHTATATMSIEKESLLAMLTSNGQSAGAWRNPADVTTAELRELLATDAFTQAAMEKTTWQGLLNGNQREIRIAFAAFRDAIEVTSLGERLVAISAEDADPQTAQQLVDAVLETYIQWQLTKNSQESVAAQKFFADLIDRYRQDLRRSRNALQSYLESHPEPTTGSRPPEERMEIARLEAELWRGEERLSEALKNEERARLAQAKAESLSQQTYTVIDAPSVPVDTRSLQRAALVIGAFAVVGLFLSVAGIAVGALMDRTLRFSVDVRQALDLPLLAMVATEGPIQPGHRAQMASGTHNPQRADATNQPGRVKPSV